MPTARRGHVFCSDRSCPPKPVGMAPGVELRRLFRGEVVPVHARILGAAGPAGRAGATVRDQRSSLSEPDQSKKGDFEQEVTEGTEFKNSNLLCYLCYLLFRIFLLPACGLVAAAKPVRRRKLILV